MTVATRTSERRAELMHEIAVATTRVREVGPLTPWRESERETDLAKHDAHLRVNNIRNLEETLAAIQGLVEKYTQIVDEEGDVELQSAEHFLVVGGCILYV